MHQVKIDVTVNPSGGGGGINFQALGRGLFRGGAY